MTYEEVIDALENNVVELLRKQCEEALGVPLTRSDVVKRKEVDPVLNEHFKEIMQGCLEKIESDGTLEKMMADDFNQGEDKNEEI